MAPLGLETSSFCGLSDPSQILDIATGTPSRLLDRHGSFLSSDGSQSTVPWDGDTHFMAVSGDRALVLARGYHERDSNVDVWLSAIQNDQIVASTHKSDLGRWTSPIAAGGDLAIWDDMDMRFLAVDGGSIRLGQPVHFSLPSPDPWVTDLSAAGADRLTDLVAVWESKTQSPAIILENRGQRLGLVTAPEGCTSPSADLVVYQWVTHMKVSENATIETWTVGMPHVRAAVALDGGGAIVADSEGVHRLGPDGKELWAADVQGATRLAVGSDGSIFAASKSSVTRISPKGAIRWVESGASASRPSTIAIWQDWVVLWGANDSENVLELYDTRNGKIWCSAASPLLSPSSP